MLAPAPGILRSRAGDGPEPEVGGGTSHLRHLGPLPPRSARRQYMRGDRGEERPGTTARSPGRAGRARSARFGLPSSSGGTGLDRCSVIPSDARRLQLVCLRNTRMFRPSSSEATRSPSPGVLSVRQISTVRVTRQDSARSPLKGRRAYSIRVARRVLPCPMSNLPAVRRADRSGSRHLRRSERVPRSRHRRLMGAPGCAPRHTVTAPLRPASAPAKGSSPLP